MSRSVTRWQKHRVFGITTQSFLSRALKSASRTASGQAAALFLVVHHKDALLDLALGEDHGDAALRVDLGHDADAEPGMVQQLSDMEVLAEVVIARGPVVVLDGPFDERAQVLELGLQPV